VHINRLTLFTKNADIDEISNFLLIFLSRVKNKGVGWAGHWEYGLCGLLLCIELRGEQSGTGLLLSQWTWVCLVDMGSPGSKAEIF
jgi:hypothetical protein